MRSQGSPLFFIIILYIFLICSPAISGQSSSDDTNSRETPCRAWLVQSIPTDMPHLSPVPGVLSTADVFRWLAGNSTRKLDIIAQYWQLIARPQDPNSGDYGYSKHEMKKFGSNKGLEVYQALEDAAARKVSMRLLQHSGFYPDYTEESANLASGRPNVQNVTLLLDDWFGSGIVHAKVWISDRRDVYIGSANNDWKSLTQVKEVGVYIVGCPRIAKGVESYFDKLWKLDLLNLSVYVRSVQDQQWQITRKLPCWSRFISRRERCISPLEDDYVELKHVAGYPILEDPEMFRVAIEAPGTGYFDLQRQSSYLSFAPPELLYDRYQTDEQAWVDTIKSVAVGGTVRISTMDWLGQSLYMPRTVYWSTLASAISEVVYGKHANVRLLVAYWTHSINNTDQYLKSLLYTNSLCSSSDDNDCLGKVEIKYYMVPGYNQTGPAKTKSNNHKSSGNIYPSYTRVNHGKYAVSDVRAHIGTSNLLWDYFYTTAGVSFGTYNPAIVSQLQKIFDADWNSPYAVPFEPLDEGYAFTS